MLWCVELVNIWCEILPEGRFNFSWNLNVEKSWALHIMLVIPINILHGWSEWDGDLHRIARVEYPESPTSKSSPMKDYILMISKYSRLNDLLFRQQRYVWAECASGALTSRTCELPSFFFCPLLTFHILTLSEEIPRKLLSECTVHVIGRVDGWWWLGDWVADEWWFVFGRTRLPFQFRFQPITETDKLKIIISICLIYLSIKQTSMAVMYVSSYRFSALAL